MSASVSKIIRYPIKSIGRQELSEVELSAGKWMPFDRIWGVAHERSKLGGGWEKKTNFLRGVTGPALMAVTAELDEATKTLTLSHPTAGTISARPNSPDEAAALVSWLRQLWPGDLPKPTAIYRGSDVHLTDVPGPWISLNSMASLKVLSQRAGVILSPHRFRGNIWIDGLDPWHEAEWVGKTVTVGNVTFAVKSQITRCKATMANPDTGRRDLDTLGLLDDLGHQEFGVYAEVIDGGTLSIGDSVVVPT